MLDVLRTIAEAALEAGAEIMEIYDRGCEYETKADGSFVCEADRRAEAAILRRLRAHPGIPVVAEEAASTAPPGPLGPRFFLVDALDGTRAFLERSGEFSVNVAYVEEARPVAGAIYLPLAGLLYWGSIDGGAFRGPNPDRPEPIRARAAPGEGRTLITSQPPSEQMSALFRRLGITRIIHSASARNFCSLAEGSADIYPRYSQTREWDTAAGHAILSAAGGRVVALEDGRPSGELAYGKFAADFINPHFIAHGAG